MLQYSNIRNKYYEDNDVFICWNMQQNSFYYMECEKNNCMHELVDIIVCLDKKTNKERMAFVWEKSDTTKKLKAKWDNRPH